MVEMEVCLLGLTILYLVIEVVVAKMIHLVYSVVHNHYQGMLEISFLFSFSFYTHNYHYFRGSVPPGARFDPIGPFGGLPIRPPGPGGRGGPRGLHSGDPDNDELQPPVSI